MYRRRRTFIISLAVAVLIALTAAVMLLCGVTRNSALADDRWVQLDGSTVFNIDNIRGAEITSWKGDSTTETNEDGGTSTKDHYFTLFKIGEEQTISYRQNLAYNWKTGIFEGESEYLGGYVENTFSMEFAFASVDFEKFTIRFQSQQYAYADGYISENFAEFTINEDGMLCFAVKKDVEDEVTPKALCNAKDETFDKIKLQFGDFSEGEYKIRVSVNDTVVSDGDFSFVNVFKSYATYVSSGDSAVTPLRFGAEFTDEQIAGGKTADLIMFSINGQSFEVYDRGNNGNYDYVQDTAAPVMCFGSTPSYLEYGKTIDFTYKTIDVLASSPRTTAYYYVLSGTQYEDANYDYDKSSEKWDEEIKNITDEEEKEKVVNPYISVSSGSEIRIVRTEDTFVPAKYLHANTDYKVYGLVKLYFEISDMSPTSSYAKKDYVYAEWYVDISVMDNIYDIKGESGKTSWFIKLVDGKDGPTLATNGMLNDYYANDGAKSIEELYEEKVEEIRLAYQKRIDDAIFDLKDKDTEDGSNDHKLFGGGNNKFYLPSIEADFLDCSLDRYCSTSDYTYSLYYQTSSGSSNTNKTLAFNKMSISLNEANVRYYFKIYIKDAFGNAMRYPKTKLDDDGNPVMNGNVKVIEWVEIPEDKIWDDEYEDLLPEFYFDVDYKPATVEAPKNPSLAYVGTSYSGLSFTINGVSGTYSSKYDLYIFKRSAMYEKTGVRLTNAEIVKNFESLFDNTYDPEVDTRSLFITVKPASTLVAGNPNYKLFKAIDWNSGSVSFVPQSVDDSYVVKLTLTDSTTNNVSNSYAVVTPSVQTTALPGENDWAENNVTSIVLLAIAGVCLAALVVLLLIRPKDKNDIDAVYVEASEKQSKKFGKAKKAKADKATTDKSDS